MPPAPLLRCVFLVLLLPAALALAEDKPLPVVPAVDLDRYLGTWHEIARYPNYFERMCERDVTATYARNTDGTIKVVNACRKAGGDIASAEGQARVAAPSKLQVRFAPHWLAWIPLVWGNYWVIDLAPDYSYAVVGEPSREYLWILARERELPPEVYRRITARLRELDYDPRRLTVNPVRP